MKKLLILALMLLATATYSWADTAPQYVLHINKTDGTVEGYDIEDVKSMTSLPAADASSYHGVDLGLSVEWATVNVDVQNESKRAEAPEAPGGFYGWGDPTGLHMEQPENSTWEPYTKDTMVCLDSFYGGADAPLEITGTALDIAHALWGGDWRMPTHAEQEELRLKCTWTQETLNGMKGYRVTGPNGNSIFLPGAGYRFAKYTFKGDYLGFYWSSTRNPLERFKQYAYALHLSEKYYDWASDARYYGQSVRPVRNDHNIIVETTDGTQHVYRIDEVQSITIDEFKIGPDYYEAVDLGLSVKWAAVNLDIDRFDGAAPAPEVPGGYYGWGDPTGRNHSTNGDDYPGFSTERSISGTDLDLVHITWGGDWRLPTMQEVLELRNECTWTWETVNGKPGYRVTGKNGNSIFLPTTGFRTGETVDKGYVGTHGYYWSGTNVSSVYVYELAFSQKYFWEYNYRYNGFQMRGVRR